MISWPRVIAEGLVIIVSILLALAADAWWDGVQQRRGESEALTALRADLSSDAVGLASVGRALAARDSAAAWFLRNRDAASPLRDSLQYEAGLLLTLGRYQRSQAAYLSLRDGGRLGLIRDDGLRNQVVAYFEQEQEAWVQQLSDWLKVREDVIARLSLHGRPLAPADLARTIPATSSGLPGFDPNWAWDEIRTDDNLMVLLTRFGSLAGQLSRVSGSLTAKSAALSTSLADAF